VQAKAVEIPGFGIIGPLIEKWAMSKDPLNKGTITKQTFSLKDSQFLRNVILALTEDFCGADL
jgi:hypothetical protein